ncbi:MAG: carboxypeptidase-like regulatory domain-containing protein [Ferruginibacter sp.]
MKKLLALVIIISGIIILHSCKKDGSDKKATETTNPPLPDLTTQTNASVSGFITDENGDALAGAVVKGGTITATTDARGYFKIANAGFAKTAGFVQVTKAGYFTGYRTFLPQTGKETFIRLQMVTKTLTGTVSSSSGGTVTSSTDGSSVTLPADAVVMAANGAAYSGNIKVSTHWFDPSDAEITLQTMPGDLRGIDESGYLKSLTTYGMLTVELTSDAGELLQMASGKQASMQIPIPAQIQGTAPASIALWYFDETNGLWKQDGTGTKSGNNYEATVSHFTSWNWDVPASNLILSGQFVNAADQPIINLPVLISVPGIPNAATMAYTDADGNFFAMVPQNTDLVVQVLDQCGNVIFSQNVTTQTSNMDLGMLLINPPTGAATITGQVVNCNNNAVTNGLVFFTNSNGLCQAVPVQNGSFTLNMIYCANPMSYFAIDLDNNEESTPQTMTVVSGANNVGTITVCGASTATFVNLTVNGVAQVMGVVDNVNSTSGPDYPDPNSKTSISNNTPDGIMLTQLQFDGPVGTGTKTGLYGVVLSTSSNNAYTNGTDTGPVSINITEYGPVGGYISGNFSTDRWYRYAVSSPTMYSIQCSFRVLRTE